MEFVPFIFITLIIALLIYSWYSARRATLAFVKIAGKLGFTKSQFFPFTYVELHGKLNGSKTSVEVLFSKHGSDLTLVAHISSGYEIYIRTPRNFLNVDILNLFPIQPRPPKIHGLSNKYLDVFGDDVRIATKVVSDSQMSGLLKRYIEDQKDFLEISHSKIVLRHLVKSISFPWNFNMKIVESEFTGMLSLIEWLASLERKRASITETLICPFCRDNLKKEGMLIACEQCSAIHHDGCWNENGNKCAVFKCTGIAGINIRET